jgi:hypothetical protein
VQRQTTPWLVKESIPSGQTTQQTATLQRPGAASKLAMAATQADAMPQPLLPGKEPQ